MIRVQKNLFQSVENNPACKHDFWSIFKLPDQYSLLHRQFFGESYQNRQEHLTLFKGRRFSQAGHAQQSAKFSGAI